MATGVGEETQNNPLLRSAAAVKKVSIATQPASSDKQSDRVDHADSSTERGVADGSAVLLPFPDRRRRPRDPASNPDRRKCPRSAESNQVDVELSMKRLGAGCEWVDVEGNHSTAYRAAKRMLDIIGALTVLMLIWPIMLTVFVVLTITTRGKAIFAQDRVGYRGRVFKMYKFRTMRLDAHKLQHMIQNEKEGPIFKNRRDPRITSIGRWLRATSIDETPQLFNVLFGDMSLVGPRPMVLPEVARQAHWQHRRLGVKPGLTCLWQISGRSEIGFEDWMRMDLWYLSNQNLQTDLKLLAKTPLKVITCKGAY